MTDKTCLSYWFPIIEAAGLPVPKTRIVKMPPEAFEDVYLIFDGHHLTDASAPFFEELLKAADEIGYPAFLRTGHTSGKHSWSRTCFLDKPEHVIGRVASLVEYSEMAGIIGLPCDVFAVREFLPTMPIGKCPNFRDMPVCREFRFFVDGPEIKCWHPYWPLEALIQGGFGLSHNEQEGPDLNPLYRLTADEEKALSALASRAGQALGGGWSVDLLETSRGWYVTDLAEASKSFHWEGCPNGR